MSKTDQIEFKTDWWSVFDDIATEPGEPAVRDARHRAQAFAAKWKTRYPSAVACPGIPSNRGDFHYEEMS